MKISKIVAPGSARLRTITFGSVCSGIESASVAGEPIGFKACWLSEIEPFPCAVLEHRFPATQNVGDMLTIKERIRSGELEAPEVLIGGTPCQAFSVAGLRGGLDDARGQLALEFVKILEEVERVRKSKGQREPLFVWENVPGVLSSKDNAFGCLLGALAGEAAPLEPAGKRWTNAGFVLGPERSIAWRILDAQHFGLAQRRRRVFLVASAGTVDPRAVLFEFAGVRRDSPPRRSSGPGTSADVAPCLGASGRGTSRVGETRGQDPVVACFGGNRTSGPIDVSPVLNACATASGRQDFESEGLVVMPTMTAGGPGSSSHNQTSGQMRDRYIVPVPKCATGDVFHTLRSEGFDASEDGTGRGSGAVALGLRVRRLTPTECERLQGFPDGFTQIPWRGKPASECPDGPRYKALGNSKAVPVVRWLLSRVRLAMLPVCVDDWNRRLGART